MNNEPVAWIAYDDFGDFMLEAKPKGNYPWQPLYTHPAKTLTDEVLMQLYEVADYSPESYLEEARAILRKANNG